jgi:PAT family beta-lactamase induction signal transducer AmpG
MLLIQQIFTRKMLVAFLMGISAGLPLLLVGGTLQAFMTDMDVDLGTIGLFALVGLPYTVKPFWSPLIDRFTLPFLGRRKGYIALFQAALTVLVFTIGMLNPQTHLWLVGLNALLIAFFSASQDIVIDAHRREMLHDHELGLGSSLYVNGYRIGMLIAGALALGLADHFGPQVVEGMIKTPEIYDALNAAWAKTYSLMAACMGVCILFTLFAPEDDLEHLAPKSMKEAVIGPFREFFTRTNWQDALLMLSFIILYKVGDQMAAHMYVPFILKMGFTKTQYAIIVKGVGLISALGGGLLGGIIILKIGINKSLWLFGFFQMVSTFGFSVLALMGLDETSLAAVIAIENIASGMGTSVYAAYMASITNKKFTATQYGLLTSLMGVPRVLAAAPTGYLADAVGWFNFFLICTLIAIPGMLLLFKIAPWNSEVETA